MTVNSPFELRRHRIDRALSDLSLLALHELDSLGGHWAAIRERLVLAGKARAALLFGEDAGLMAAVLEGSVAIERTETLQQAVSRAAQLAQPGDRVLLSPACASLDQFRSYIERGRCFADAVGELAQ